MQGTIPTLEASYQPPSTVTVESRTWAAAVLSDLPVVVLFHREKTVEVATSSDGVLMRRAYAITCTPDYRFAINLHQGASRRDLEHARYIIKRAKAGSFLDAGIWSPKADSAPGWVMKVFWKYQGDEPKDELRECGTAGCIDEYHVYIGEYQDDPCRIEMIVHPEGWYTVQGSKYHGEEWRAWADADELPEGVAGLRAVRDLANDFAWMQGECDHLNDAVRSEFAEALVPAANKFDQEGN